MYLSLLVPLDGLVSSVVALPIAVGIARRTGATLYLMHVRLPPSTLYIEGMQVADHNARASRLERGRAYLEGVRVRLASESDITIACDVFDKPVVGAIADQTLPAELGRLDPLTLHRFHREPPQLDHRSDRCAAGHLTSPCRADLGAAHRSSVRGPHEAGAARRAGMGILSLSRWRG